MSKREVRRPNLFDYATHELSQDAVLIWLFRYADPKYDEDQALHEVAEQFCRLFLCGYNKKISKIDVWKQWEHIDITVKVNDDIGLVIEDKTGAHLHGDQLACYRKSAESWAKEEGVKVDYFYLNTENPNTDDRQNVLKEGYKIISRADLLAVLNSYKGDNPILCDYRDRLTVFEEETVSFRTLPVKKWTDRAWQGFYDWIHSIRENSTWELLNSPGGAFWSTWWNNYTGWVNDEFSIYPQIDQGRFTFKMYCETDSNKEWGYRLRDTLEAIAAEMSLTEVHRPARMSFRGCATALLVVDTDDYLGPDIVDFNAVKGKLEKYEQMIEECKRRIKQG